MATDPIGNVEAFITLNQAVSFRAKYQAQVANQALDMIKEQGQQVVKLLNSSPASNPNLGKLVNLSG